MLVRSPTQPLPQPCSAILPSPPIRIPPPSPRTSSALSLTKSADPTTYDHVGETISYTYTQVNTGNVTLSSPFDVEDNKATDEDCPATPTSLAPGASITCSATYDITQSDLDSGSVTNTATATAKFGDTTVTSNMDTITVAAVQSPALTLFKTATPTTYSKVGDLIGYSYKVTNRGNVTLTGPFTVADNKATVTCPTSATLAPGASITCTASYTISQADLDTGSVANTATAKGSFAGDDVSSNEDSKTVTAVQNPTLTLVKTATPTTFVKPAT